MRTSKQYALGGLLLSFAWMLAGGCASSTDGSPAGRGGSDPMGSSGGSVGGPTLVSPDAGDVDGGAPVPLNELCGVGTSAGTCVPDSSKECRTFMPPVEGTTGGGGAGGESAGSLGEAGAFGLAGQPSVGGHAGEGGQAGEGAGVGGASGAGGAQAGAGGMTDGAGGEAPGEPGATSYSCQVTRQNNQLVRQCVIAGSGAATAPCFSAADCGRGLACVTEGDVGRCLPYCCKLDTPCDQGAYCAVRPLRKSPTDTSREEPPHVPVCVPADNCSLEEPHPCPAGSECRCTGDTACMVVRNDGATTCLKPGNGQQGEACPCAWNHVCSSLTNECLKLCRTDPTKDDCGVQKCQASSELPKNFGVCVGPR